MIEKRRTFIQRKQIKYRRIQWSKKRYGENDTQRSGCTLHNWVENTIENKIKNIRYLQISNGRKEIIALNDSNQQKTKNKGEVLIITENIYKKLHI